MSSEMRKSPKRPRQNAAGQEEGSGTEECANEALLVEETELTRNDDCQGLVDCPENSAVMELKQPKLDLKVSDNSENPASDDSQGGDASGKQTFLTEPVAREADQEPEQKLDALEEQAAKGTTSVDEPGTDNPGEESGADNSYEMVTSCSGKSLRSVEANRGDAITLERGAARGLLMLKYSIDRDLIYKHIHRVAGNSAAIELKEPKLDHEVLDNSVEMQEEEQKVYLDAPAPSNSSEEESSDIIDGEANQNA